LPTDVYWAVKLLLSIEMCMYMADNDNNEIEGGRMKVRMKNS